MTIKPEIITKKTNKVPTYESKLANDIVEIIQSRTLNSDTARGIDSNLYVYVAIDVITRDKMSPLFSELKPKMYFAKDESLTTASEVNTFADVLKRAVLRHVDVPSEIKACHIYVSLTKKEQADLWVNPSEASASEQEHPKFVAVEPIFALDEVVMNDDEREAIMRAITLVKERELVFDKWNFKKIDKHTKSILCFHGAPGTGKTMAAHGVANYLGKKILIGSYAQIESEFVGVGAKNLKAFFECASEQDAVLFIDEADTFLSKRLPSSNESAKHYNSMSNELYQLIESFNGCIIFASNHITDFDPAVISRIIEPVEFKLPDESTRKQILNNMMQEEFPIEDGKNDELLSLLAEQTEGFSGRDLRKALLIANASAAYKLKVVKGLEDEQIVIPKQLLLDSFTEVKKAKDTLDSAMGKDTTSNLLSAYVYKKQSETRYLQMAAHTLLADGIVDTKEKALFEELSSMIQITVPLVKEELPSVEDICKEATSKEERIRLLDVVIRMSVCDHKIHKTEDHLIIKVADLIGFKNSEMPSVLQYSQNLKRSYEEWAQITNLLGMSDEDILDELKNEYTEGAAYFHLAKMYQTGISPFSNISINVEKAKKYFVKAQELGFNKKQKEICLKSLK